MKSFKKIIAVAGSVALMASTALPSFAAAPTSTAADANVLAYSLESVVVPSALMVALNPQEYDVTKKAGVTDDAQVVSFNYGIANLSTGDKDVTVKFNVTGTANADKTPITFVDTEEKATFGAGDDNAKMGELKMYLAVAASDAAPKEDADTDFEVTTVDSGANTHNAEGAKLADVAMTAATGGLVAFAKGDNYANAKIAFKLDRAEYDVQDDQEITWTTTQTELASKMEITSLGDVVGFTFTGVMNKEADWTKADVATLTFTPVYEIADITGDEVATTSGGYKQIDTVPSLTLSNATANTTDDGVDFNVTFTKGTALTCEFTGLGEGVTLSSVLWGTSVSEITSTTSNVPVSGTSFTINANMWGSASAGDVKYIELTTSGGATKVVKVTIA